MRAYIAEEQSAEQLTHFADRPVREFLEDSVDVVTFVMHLEEELGVNIQLAGVGPALVHMTFKELAAELCTASPAKVRAKR
jgi:acyl carrier protein